MKEFVTLTDFEFVVNVECIHPDDNSARYCFNVNLDWDLLSPEEFNEHDVDTMIREAVEKKVNRYGYWHEVKISLSSYAYAEKLWSVEI